MHSERWKDWAAAALLAAMAYLVLVAGMSAARGDEAAVRELRTRKAAYIVERLYPRSGFGPYVGYLIDEHARLGMPAEWWWSLVYGGANFGLKVGGIAPGHCAGPMDVKHWPLVIEPRANIRWHCREMVQFYRRGVRGIALCEHIFLPAAPRDWGGGRFRQTDRRHRMVIAEGYRAGAFGATCAREEVR